MEQAIAAIADAITGSSGPFRAAVAPVEREYDALLQHVARLGPAYAFEREGRPQAIEAVRQALPLVERDLFDAILDDVACERAAIEEGLFRVAQACGQRGAAALR